MVALYSLFVTVSLHMLNNLPSFLVLIPFVGYIFRPIVRVPV